ncbi:E3 ubiquitin-protein ligase Kcmf1 isoform X1 [Maniola hyperantus]|uniref:E3 ubiquitin-protein ligase Kcmf1 isoform X1 n=1 Tax=Aphantopus hyperantus TaxID=2795564 RepID=UPI0015699225|nr:E3 ubiquitin-protein ligase Kcmf1 [Maniola hyperantus]
MNRHEGVSCDSCLKNNFRGRRYKCLICIDYDLCAACYESGATTNQHTPEHPMQCILSRSDFDLYYGGETLALEQPQAYTCPFCNRMGFTDTSLMEHVTAEHADTTLAVVCPVCASMPGGEPNFVTDDFAGHLTLEHRTGPRDLISFLDEPSGIRHGGVRRMPPSGRGVTRARRTNMHFSTSGGISSLSPSARDAVVDPIAELLSQLSGVRRGAQPGTPSQLQQLQIQLQLERQQASAARQQLERLPRRPAAAAGATAPPPGFAPAAAPPPQPDTDSQFLLAGVLSAAPATDGAEAESRAALLRGLVLASLGRAPPPPPRAPPPAPAPPPAAPPPRAKPAPRSKAPAPPDPPAVPARPRPV